MLAAVLAIQQGLRKPARRTTLAAMWNEPYLETCCRSALHRLILAGAIGRPPGLKDGPCLARLADDGFAEMRADGRFLATGAGVVRHRTEVRKESVLF